jgi:hypothetical protein
MVVMEKVTREEALKKGYLEDKKVYLKPAPRQGKMIKKPDHVGYFMYEGAKVKWTLPRDERGQLINVFINKEEQRFFEEELDIDLNPYKKDDNFWHSFTVEFSKNPVTMYEGKSFNLADPMDNLRVRVLKALPEVAPTWEERTDKPSYRFALVEQNYEETKAATEAKKSEEAWKYFGSIQNNKLKMADFISVYYNQKRSPKSIPSDATKEWLLAELSKILRDDIDTFLVIKNDEDFEIKAFITKAIKIGAISKEGVNKFKIASDNTTWSYTEIIQLMKNEQEESGDLYMKIKAQLNLKK